AQSAVLGSALEPDLAGRRITTRAMPQHADVHVDIAAGFVVPAPDGQDRTGHVDVRGDVGGIPLTAHASIDGPAIEGTFDAPKATPDMIAALAPGSKPTADVSLHADLRGR